MEVSASVRARRLLGPACCRMPLMSLILNGTPQVGYDEEPRAPGAVAVARSSLRDEAHLLSCRHLPLPRRASRCGVLVDIVRLERNVPKPCSETAFRTLAPR